MGDIVTKADGPSLTLSNSEVEELYSLAKKAFPGNGEIRADQYAQAADDTYAIYSEKYGVSMETDKLGAFEVGQSSGEHFDALVDLLRNYDSRTNLGDKISATSGANTVVAELFAAAVAK